jgi:hypothetical protein
LWLRDLQLKLRNPATFLIYIRVSFCSTCARHPITFSLTPHFSHVLKWLQKEKLMQTLKIDGNPVDIFDICQAYAQLESDYNRDGWLRERPSNQRRMESIGVQLSRLGYSDAHRWVDIEAEDTEGGDSGDDDVRFIYMMNVLKWKLPVDDGLKAAIKRTIAADFLAKEYPEILA